MKQNVRWFTFIFALCCLSACDFGNPFLDPLPDPLPDPLSYTVTFDAYGWEPGLSTTTCISGENVALPSPNPSRDGYVFAGWYTEKDGGGKRFTASTTVNADTRVYARWIKNEDAVTVTFDVDSGKPVPVPIICARGETVVSLPSPDPTRDGYLFEGWYTEKEGGGTQFIASTSVIANITVYAKWVLYLHVTFDPDGGKPAKTTVSCPSGSTVKLPSDPTRTNYVFDGWYTEKEGGGAQFTASTPVNADITVYAKWKPYLVVTFDANGGSPMATKTCAPGATVRLPAAPARAGYTFDGWYTKKEGGGKRFTSSTLVSENIVVYARWKPYPVLTFDMDDGSPTTTQTCAPGTTVALPPDPTRDDYFFEGWYTDKNGGGTQFTAKTIVTRNITVYARWIKKEDLIDVTFDADGGAPALVPITCIKGKTLEKLPAAPTRAEYTFEGWYTEKEGGGVQFTTSSVVTEDITVYAKWKPYPVVTFNTNYGVPVISSVNCAPGATVALPSPDPTRTGYVFDGWYTDQDGRGAQFTASTTVNADITVYAKWLKNLIMNGTLGLGAGSIRFPNTGNMSVQKGAALTIVLSGSNVEWSSARWEIKVDAESVSIIGSGASRTWAVPPDTKNGQYTVTVMVWIGSTLYVGNFSILITN